MYNGIVSDYILNDDIDDDSYVLPKPKDLFSTFDNDVSVESINDDDLADISTISGNSNNNELMNQSFPHTYGLTPFKALPNTPKRTKRRNSFPLNNSKSNVPLPDFSAFDTADNSMEERTHDSSIEDDITPVIFTPATPMKSPAPSRIFNQNSTNSSFHSFTMFTNNNHHNDHHMNHVITPSWSNMDTSSALNLEQQTSKLSYLEREFEILGLIGTGSCSFVYQVRSKSDGKLYAIKKSKHALRGENDLQLALKEVQTLVQLGNERCPYIMQLYEAWENDGYLHLQLELCEYGSLKRILGLVDEPLSEDMIWYLITQLTIALKLLHDRNLMHRDLKPENIYIIPPAQVKLGDFGITDNKSGINAWDGDQMYLPPEFLEPKLGKIGKAADIFALGLIAFEMGADVNLPRSGPNWQMLRNNKAILPQHRGRSTHLQEFIDHLMNRDPQNRPTIDQVVNHPIIAEYCQRLEQNYQLQLKLPPPIKAKPVKISSMVTNASIRSNEERQRITQKRMCTPPRNLTAELMEIDDDDDPSDYSNISKPLCFDDMDDLSF